MKTRIAISAACAGTLLCGGLLAFTLCPVVLLALRAPACTVIAMGALASVIWVAHRGNLAREFRRLRTKDAPPVPPGKSTP